MHYSKRVVQVVTRRRQWRDADPSIAHQDDQCRTTSHKAFVAWRLVRRLRASDHEVVTNREGQRVEGYVWILISP